MISPLVWVIPPGLPVFYAFNQVVASARLYRKSIVTMEISKFMSAGEVDICCFDKTGTITE